MSRRQIAAMSLAGCVLGVTVLDNDIAFAAGWATGGAWALFTHWLWGRP